MNQYFSLLRLHQLFGINRLAKVYREILISLFAFIFYCIIFTYAFSYDEYTLPEELLYKVQNVLGLIIFTILITYISGYILNKKSPISDESNQLLLLVNLLIIYMVTAPFVFFFSSTVEINIFARIFFIVLLPPILFLYFRKSHLPPMDVIQKQQEGLKKFTLQSVMSLIFTFLIYHALLLFYLDITG